MSGHVCSIPKSVPTWSLSLSLSLSLQPRRELRSSPSSPPTTIHSRTRGAPRTSFHALIHEAEEPSWRRRRFFTSPVLKSSKRMLTAESILFHLDQKGCFFHVKEKLKLTSPAFFSRKNGALCVLYFFCWSATSVEYEMRHGMEYRNPTSFRSLLAAFFF